MARRPGEAVVPCAFPARRLLSGSVPYPGGTGDTVDVVGTPLYVAQQDA
ncbi:DUF7019 family protein [Streptomyces roseus]